jgi:molybdopterin converting factor small subunit
VTLRVRVRLFAMQRELAGTRGVELALPDGATIEDAWAALVDRGSRQAEPRSDSRATAATRRRRRGWATVTRSR